MLGDLPGVLPGVQHLALIVEESERIATDQLSRLPTNAYTYDGRKQRAW